MKVIKDADPADFFPILLENKQKHNAAPTHSLEQLRYLKNTFPNNVQIDVGIFEDQSKAAVCYFVGNSSCTATFYLAQENNARSKNGLNILIYEGMKNAVDNGFKYYDFGCSSYMMKVPADMGVPEFKQSFGASGIFRDTYIYSFI